jgi:hypothetical protein
MLSRYFTLHYARSAAGTVKPVEGRLPMAEVRIEFGMCLKCKCGGVLKWGSRVDQLRRLSQQANITLAHLLLFESVWCSSIAAIMSGHTQEDKLKQLPDELQLATAAHVKYVQSLDTRVTEFSYWMTEHLRLNGIYWGLVALHLLRHPEALPRDETIKFVLSCQKENGGFAPAPNHHAHMLYTVSAVQILAMVDGFDELEKHGKGNGKATVGKCECGMVVSRISREY